MLATSKNCFPKMAAVALRFAGLKFIVLTEAERHKLLVEFNETGRKYRDSGRIAPAV